MVHQGYIEPQACSVAVDANGHITIYTTTQASFGVKSQNAALLQIPLNKVTVVPLEIGGGFGGKGFTVPELPTALLALKTGQPVKTVLGRDEVFRATGPAPDAYCWIKAGANKKGEVTAFEAKFYLDAGCLPGSALYVNNILVAGLSPYKLPNFQADGYDVLTNKSRSQAYRAPGPTGGRIRHRDDDGRARRGAGHGSHRPPNRQRHRRWRSDERWHGPACHAL